MEPKTTKSRSKFLRVASVLLTIAAVSGSSLLFYSRRRQTQSAAQVQNELTVIHLDPFVVNLADLDQRAFLRVGIDLGVPASARTAQSAESTTSTSLIRDTLLEILMAAQSDQLATAEGKRKLKDRMLQSLNTRAPGLNAREIYFTEFLIQK
jgi:flagellar basal body-associated protein FliL